MEHSDFLVWFFLYPIINAICLYLGAKRRKIEGKDAVSENIYAITAIINMIIWVFVAIKLY